MHYFLREDRPCTINIAGSMQVQTILKLEG